MIKLTLIRDILGDEFTLGRMYVTGQLLGQTCEDKDRDIEDGGIRYMGQVLFLADYIKSPSHSLTDSKKFSQKYTMFLSFPAFGFMGVIHQQILWGAYFWEAFGLLTELKTVQES